MTAGLTNLGWSGGEMVGALSAGAVAEGFGLTAAFFGLAVLLLAAATLTWSGRRREILASA
jgi:hypothetical protein